MPQARIYVSTTQDEELITIGVSRQIIEDPFLEGYGTSFLPGWLEDLDTCGITDTAARLIAVLADTAGVDAIFIRPKEVSIYRDALSDWDKIFPPIIAAFKQVFGIPELRIEFADTIHAHFPRALISSEA